MDVVITLSKQDVRNIQSLQGQILIEINFKAYFAPNDDAENARLDMHHHLATLLLNRKLHVAPIGKTPQRILDVGCGTGIWSIDIGKFFCECEDDLIANSRHQGMNIPLPK